MIVLESRAYTGKNIHDPKTFRDILINALRNSPVILQFLKLTIENFDKVCADPPDYFSTFSHGEEDGVIFEKIIDNKIVVVKVLNKDMIEKLNKSGV